MAFALYQQQQQIQQQQLSYPSQGYPPQQQQAQQQQQANASANAGAVPFQAPNRNQGMVFDGKRMRKAISRKYIDYNATVLNYIHVRCFFFH